MEHITPILLFIGWYLIAGAAAAIVGNKTRIESWCEEHPKAALVLHLLRASGFDYIKAVVAIGDFAKSKAGKLPPLPCWFVLVLPFIIGGCSEQQQPVTQAIVRTTLSRSCDIIQLYSPTELEALTGHPAEQFEMLRKICMAAEVADKAIYDLPGVAGAPSTTPIGLAGAAGAT